MDYAITPETFTSFAAYREGSGHNLKWNSPFTLPAWMQVWWRHFQNERKPYLVSVSSHDQLVGLAPLRVDDGTARLIGDPDVCDFVDFITAPGREAEFFRALLDHLSGRGIDTLELGHVRPDSTVCTALLAMAAELGWSGLCEPNSVSLEAELPAGFDDYLETLAAKQRHEVRRKMRRLEKMGEVRFRSLIDRQSIAGALPIFFALFSESRSDKATFLSDAMRSFFEDMASAMSGAGLMRVGILDLNRKPIAALIYFDFEGVRYLYNSGYDPGYGDLSAGLLSKVFCIQDTIEKGLKRFDFLKGAEPYKQRLGGKEITLYSCRITRSQDRE